MKTLVLILCAALSLTAAAGASVNPNAAAVLNIEARWVRALNGGDVATVAQILAPSFVHINFHGKLQHRDGTLAAAAQRKPYVQHLSGETVDLAGDAAIVHGVNAVTQSGRVVLRLRFTDVFERQGGRWRAISAQETAIATGR